MKTSILLKRAVGVVAVCGAVTAFAGGPSHVVVGQATTIAPDVRLTKTSPIDDQLDAYVRASEEPAAVLGRSVKSHKPAQAAARPTQHRTGRMPVIARL